MSYDNYIPPFVVVIDTNEYAGNFEREMCAFCTGHVGECDVGRESAALFDKDYPSNNPFGEWDYIVSVPDEHGCHRPVSIWLTSLQKSTYNSVAILFHKRPTDKMIDIIKERAKIYVNTRWTNEKVKILGFKLIEQKVESRTTEV